MFDKMSSYNVEEYSNEAELDGHHDKQFVRFDAEKFKPLIDELRKGNRNYVTYLGDFFDNSQGYTPKFLSVLIKEHNKSSPEKFFSEVAGSRVANAMNMPTVYNDIVWDEEGNPRLLSVDFVQSGESIETLKDSVDEELPTFINGQELLDALDSIKHKYGLTDEEILVLKKDVLRMYMFRKLVLADFDFSLNNIVFIFKDGKVRLAPNFDMEYSFGPKNNPYTIISTFEICNKFSPDLWRDFERDFDDLMESGKFGNLINSLEIDEEWKAKFIYSVQANYEIFNKFNEKCKVNIKFSNPCK